MKDLVRCEKIPPAVPETVLVGYQTRSDCGTFFDSGLHSSNTVMSYSEEKQHEEYENLLVQRLSCILKCQAY